jgi:soluble lytic murein transglycosylase-like protein
MSRIRVALAVLALCASARALADDAIYSFTDAQGRVYLSNFPVDHRYRMLIAPSPKARARTHTPDDSRPPARYDEVIRVAANRTGVDVALLHAVIAVESAYDARAVSHRGAAGLMQLMPATAKRYRVSDVFDPAENVRGGAEHLAELLRKFDDDLRLALAAYNAGEAAVLKYGRRVPPYGETAAYVPKVVEIYRKNRWAM